MPLTLSDLDFLTSVTGTTLLDDLAQRDLREANTLKLVSQLRKTYTQAQVSAGLTMARLREKAQDKFGVSARVMFFTDSGLQQASDPRIRRYRAQGMAGRVVDACCGIGTDSLAFASSGADVHGIDLDPVRIAIARHNADVLDLSARFSVGDVAESLPSADTIFYDPARRTDTGKRIYDIEAYIPPFSLVEQWPNQRVMAKIAPGVAMTQLEPYGGAVEFISVNGDLKEAVWYSAPAFSGLRATLLTPDDGVHHWQRENSDPDVLLAEPRAWLCEPDPAILRANLVRDVAAAFAGTMLDDTIAYFTTDACPDSPWVRAWRVRDWMPYHLKKLRAYLRARNIGTVTVKKRGSPITPEELTRKLKLKGDESCTLVLTRYQEKPIVVICDDFL
jgi:SAM-dependent methyltransferase